MLKSVLHAIPTYTMGIFQLPKSITSQINVLLKKYWWGSGGDHSKIHWQQWSRMTLSKSRGGLGFRNMKNFNVALLSKQAWRILQNTSSLVRQALKHKYFPHGHFLYAKLGYKPSYAWKNVLAIRELLNRVLIWRVWNGKNINIWNDSWIPKPFSNKI